MSDNFTFSSAALLELAFFAAVLEAGFAADLEAALTGFGATLALAADFALGVASALGFVAFGLEMGFLTVVALIRYK